MSNILISLMKIAREGGEDEFETIHSLKVEYNISITPQEIIKRMNNQVGIVIFEPFNKIHHQELRNEYKDDFNLNQFKKFVKIIEINEKKYISYPIFIPISIIQDVIFEDLREEHGIILNSISESDWIQIKSNEIWKQTEIQVAREIIAEELYYNSAKTSSFLCP